MGRSKRRRFWILTPLAIALWSGALAPAESAAQDSTASFETVQPPPQPQRAERCGRDVDRWSRKGRTIGLGIAGITTAFVTHELGHIVTNLAYGVKPKLEGVRFLKIFPFFTISPGVTCNGDICTKRNGDRFRGGRRGKYFIVAGGFNVGHLTTEIILSREPNQRCRYRPFIKGMLYFHLGLSMGYSLSAWFGVEPPSGDVGSMAEALNINPRVMAAFVFLPAALDLVRFLLPENKWLPWVSRSGKATLIGIGFIF